MNADDFDGSIRNIAKFFTEVGTWASTVYQVGLPRSEEFNKLSMTSKDYVEIYEAGLSLSHYNVLLDDLSYYQFSRKNDAEYALAFYPNPRVSGSVDARNQLRELEIERESGDLTADEFDELAACMPANAYIPRIRFEYSKKQYSRMKHPGAHFHIGMSGEDRWCSGRKLSPRSFGLLVTRMYYPEIWWPRSRFSKPEEEWDSKDAMANCVDNRLMTSIQEDGVSDLLHPQEKMTFHFNAMIGEQQDPAYPSIGERLSRGRLKGQM